MVRPGGWQGEHARSCQDWEPEPASSSRLTINTLPNLRAKDGVVVRLACVQGAVQLLSNQTWLLQPLAITTTSAAALAYSPPPASVAPPPPPMTGRQITAVYRIAKYASSVSHDRRLCLLGAQLTRQALKSTPGVLPACMAGPSMLAACTSDRAATWIMPIHVVISCPGQVAGQLWVAISASGLLVRVLHPGS